MALKKIVFLFLSSHLVLFDNNVYNSKGNHFFAERENTMAFKKRFVIQEAGHSVQDFSSSAKRPCLGTMSSASSSKTHLTFPTSLSSYPSSGEVEAHSSDTGTDNSTWYPDTSSSESSLDVADDNHDCKVFSTLRHGAVSLSLVGTNLWYRFFNLGTEMIINRQGRYVFVLFASHLSIFLMNNEGYI